MPLGKCWPPRKTPEGVMWVMQGQCQLPEAQLHLQIESVLGWLVGPSIHDLSFFCVVFCFLDGEHWHLEKLIAQKRCSAVQIHFT